MTMTNGFTTKMTTKVTVDNHGGFKLEVTFENKIEGVWQRSHSTIMEETDQIPRSFYIHDGHRIIVEEI